MALFPTYKAPRASKKYLVKDVDMRFSFERLMLIAVQEVGADFDRGDICYFQNSQANKRKVLVKRGGNVVICYWKKVKGSFAQVNTASGEISNYIDFFK